MAEYDSILKEKKKYENPIKDNTPKKFPWFKIDLLCIILVLIISYIFYYIKILTPEQIFLNDLHELTDKYQAIFEPLKLEQLNNNNNIEGTITFNNKNYNYKLVKNEDQQKIDLSFNDKSLSYYTLNNDKYLKLSSFKEQYIKLTNNNNYNILNNLKNYLSNNLSQDKFIKKFYLNSTTPIVESNLVLNNEDFISALNLTNLDNSYEVLCTFKNHSITNEIISMKITINNQTTSARSVLLYENGILTYKDDKQNLKFQLEQNNEDFTLKIYKDETLFSVLTGTKQESSYKYMYQVIDKIYNITLNIKEDNNNYLYELESNIETDGTTINKKMSITAQVQADIILENTELANSINYDTLTEQEQTLYETSLETIIGDLRQFIKEYQ